MKARASIIAVAALLPALFSACCYSQSFTPQIGYAYPAGGRQGATFQVVVGGQFLGGATNAYVTGGGVKVAVIDHFKPMTPQQFNAARDRLRELMEKKQVAGRQARRVSGPQTARGSNRVAIAWTAADERSLMELRQKLATYQRRPTNPAIAETVTLRINLAPDVEPGPHELRVASPLGLSNPLVFCVGDLPEVTEKEAPKRPDEPVPRKGPAPQPKAGPEPEIRVSIPSIVNGQITPGDVDRYRFSGRKGQHLVVAVSARELIPYLADAVPGWFQATVALYDSKGKELAYDDDFRSNPDPVLHLELPADGEYVVEVKDAIFRGREDFVYRIAIGELPYITSVFPLGGKVGEKTSVELIGWNLPAAKLVQEPAEPGLTRFSTTQEGRLSNRVPFAADTLPEILDKESNDQLDTAQPVTLPIIINGRFDRPGDRDVFRFDGRAGDRVVAEVFARRLNSPVDSVLKLLDAQGKQIDFNDDCEDKGTGLNTHHADSLLTATLPASGAYFVQLSEAQQQAGPEYAYRLRLGPPRPDFELRIVPASVSLRGGSSVPLTVYALRKDGFTNEIQLELKDCPEGFLLAGARVPAHADKVRITLAAPPSPTREPVSIQLQGRAKCEGRELVRPGVPAEDMMQAFAYRHLVPARELQGQVSGRGFARSGPRIIGATPLKIPAGGTASIKIVGGAAGLTDRIQLELNEPPDGIEIQNVSALRDGTEIVFHSDAAKVKPGLKGNLIIDVLPGKNATPGKKGKAPQAKKRTAFANLPAIPFEIVAR